MGKTEREGERGRQRGEEARKREERYKWKRAAHLPDGSSGRAQRAAMAVSQYGAPPPDCHTAANTNSAITLLVCVFCIISSGTWWRQAAYGCKGN